MNDISDLTLKINSEDAKTASANLDALDKSGKNTAATASILESSFAKLAAILGPAALAGAVALAVKSSIALEESWVRLAEIAGTTASAISALDLPARLSGTSLDTVAQAVARLSKSLGDAALGDVQKQGIFKAIGIDPKDGRDAVTVMLDVAKAFSNMKDQNVAASASMQILNRSFAELRPFMRELTEQGTVQARVTDEQAAAAKRFEDTLTKISFSAQTTRMALAEGMLPSLQAIASAFSELKGNTELAKAAGEAFGTGLRVIAELAIRTGTGVLTLGNYIAGLAAITGKMADKDWAGAMSIAKDLDTKIASIQAKSDKLLENLHNAAGAAGNASPKEGRKEGSDEGAGTGQEEALRRLMKDKELFESRMIAAKAFGENYANLIKVNNTLVGEAYKQGLMSEEEMLRRQAANEQDKMQMLIVSLEKQRQLAQDQGNKAKAQEAIEGVTAANAAIVANEIITQEKIRTLRAQTDLEWRRSLELRFASQVESQLTEFEILQKELAEKENLIDIWEKEGVGREQLAGIQRANLYAMYENKKTEILDAQEKKRANIQKVYHQINAESLNAWLQYMSVMQNSKSREMFEVSKAAATASAIINTFNAATGAFAAMAPIPYVGPYLGAAAAAAAIVAGLANVATIQSQSFGGGSAGGAPAVPTFSASPTTGLPTNAGTPNAGQPQGADSTTIINLHGQSFSDEQIRDLFDKINQNTRNGGRVLVN